MTALVHRVILNRLMPLTDIYTTQGLDGRGGDFGGWGAYESIIPT